VRVGESVCFPRVPADTVPEWEDGDHFRTEVEEKMGFEKRFESGAARIGISTRGRTGFLSPEVR